MKTGRSPRAPQDGSVLVIVLWIALGLVIIALYFANSMSFELRASDNRVASMAADQAIEGAARYVSTMLALQATNGLVPDVTTYYCEAVPVGEAHFWLIGRAGPTNQVQPDQVFFGLVDEGSKLNLNSVTASMIGMITNMTAEMAANIVDWRNTNGTASANGDGPTVYLQMNPSYLCKNAPYETVGELRLIYGMDLSTLFGEDLNLNGALDPCEVDTNRNNQLDSGLLEYFTVYSREPNTQADGTARVSISSLTGTGGGLAGLLQTNISAARATAILAAIGLGATGGGAGAGRGGGAGGGTGTGTGGSTPGGRGSTATTTVTFASPLQFFMRSGMTAEEFALIAGAITVTNGSYITGRINVNTASAAVLNCLPGMTSDTVQQLLNYRQSNPNILTSIAWVRDALSGSTSALTTLAEGDYITTQSYQFSADVAALGPYARGYRRVKFVFDTSSGTPQIIYRQDLSHLGWALGRYVRQTWVAKDTR